MREGKRRDEKSFVLSFVELCHTRECVMNVDPRQWADQVTPQLFVYQVMNNSLAWSSCPERLVTLGLPAELAEQSRLGSYSGPRPAFYGQSDQQPATDCEG